MHQNVPVFFMGKRQHAYPNASAFPRLFRLSHKAATTAMIAIIATVLTPIYGIAFITMPDGFEIVSFPPRCSKENNR